jgi:FG-GAP repeat
VMRRIRGIGFVAAIVIGAAPIAMACVPATTAAAAPVVNASHPLKARGDFDGDGKADIVVGAPGGNRVRVIYSKATPHARWIASPDPQAHDFGVSLAIGDFNGDGFADLAVGAPGYTDAESSAEEGAVFIYSGSTTGLHYTGTVLLGPNNPDDDNELGTSLSAGDVNGDGFGDLAVGNPGPEGGGDGEGLVRVYFGAQAGLTAANNVNIFSSNPVEEGNFGQSVVLADVNGDGFKDLVVGEPGGGPSLAGDVFPHVGDVQVFYGSATGFGPQHATFIGTKFAASGSLGEVLAAGDVNHDRYADVVAGAPDATVKGKSLAGKVLVLFGHKHGLSARGATVFSTATPHVPGAPLSRERFGAAVAIGDVNADGRADVIVGTPGATVVGKRAAGEVYVFHGTKTGVTALGCQALSQATKGVPGAAVSGSEFGSAVTTIGATNAAHRDLLIGVPVKHNGGLLIELATGRHGVSGAHARLIKDSRVGDALGSVLPQ